MKAQGLCGSSTRTLQAISTERTPVVAPGLLSKLAASPTLTHVTVAPAVPAGDGDLGQHFPFSLLFPRTPNQH